jgi:hypothetical protein
LDARAVRRVLGAGGRRDVGGAPAFRVTPPSSRPHEPSRG